MIVPVRVWAAYCAEETCHDSLPGPAPMRPDPRDVGGMFELYAALDAAGWVRSRDDDTYCPTHAPLATFTPIQGTPPLARAAFAAVTDQSVTR